ncbi:hypothetical protein SSX86_008238 [Deinandra increscens subsp. villosa]|uniref:Mechanosensitive ion channel protein n=1 Tax=Deinandra increscens subsp. villosa TaxID=3103831 RepID=A0AAP0DBB4_9ASTR
MDQRLVVKIESHEKGKEDNNNRAVSDSFRDDDDLADCKAASSSSDNDSDGDEHRLPNHNEGAGGECTSFQRRASFVTSKTRQSRLTDSREHENNNNEEEEDEEEDESVFGDDNPPGDLKDNKLDAMTTIIQWISLVLILTSLISTLRFPKWKGRSFRGLFMWQWELLILVLICGRLVSGWCVRVAVFFIERNFLLRKRVLYFVYGVRTPVQNCIWLCWVLIAWSSIFNETVEARRVPLLEVINKFMVCMLVTASLWLAKTLVVKVLASSFHVNKFFDRIQDALFNQYVIETLSGPPLVEIRNRCHKLGEKKIGAYSFKRVKGGRRESKSSKKKKKQKQKLDEAAVTIDHLHRLNNENVSAWNMKRLMKIIRHGSLTTLDERLKVSYSDEPGTEIRSELEAKRAARSIFMNVTRSQSK